ncbi:phosphoribosyl-AMP cyclohydrolase [Pseudoalteromonas aurantia]|uniref:Phosphoribosyl-AMP cyclohydrolase n=1 Tax=Pseudoalteromonas aurantia 208 TaxID=1314867 RepID=A0ABR9E6L7_9GAMM|nr:phosphoribosyl-AMP cyclohydrolase [Pseudoalteromonas aurantia]MBE0366442.1 phosphoribosyl-AMP cyclohydrolase [Pseudoalteromonas aurantia 208]
MQHTYFQSIEYHPKEQPIPLDEVLAQLAFNQDGLIPVITQDTETKQVLMMAWMNIDALKRTLNTGRVTYWSRSRQNFWVKGETSGHVQLLVNLSFDCDGDAVLCEVHQTGAACHTGRRHCFYLKVEEDHVRVTGEYQKVEEV